MDRKLKALYYGNLVSFGLFLFGNSINNSPTVLFSLATGLPSSAYLLGKLPSKEQKELQEKQRTLELETQISKLLDEKQWYEDLNTRQTQKLRDERSLFEQQLKTQNSTKDAAIQSLKVQHEQQLEQVEQEYRQYAQKRDSEIQQLKAKYDLEIVELKTSYSAMITQLNAERSQAIALLQQEYTQAVEALTQKLEDCVTQAETIKNNAEQRVAEAAKQTEENQQFKTQLLKLKDEIELAQKQLALEEKRVRLDIRDERSSIKKQLDDSLLELRALQAINQRQQLEIAELKSQNEQLFQELYGEKSEGDALVSQIQALFAEQELPTEFISRQSKKGIDTICLKALSSNWRQTTLDHVAEVLPGLMPVTRPEIEAKNGRLQIRFDNRSWLDKINDAPEDWLEKLYLICAKDGKNVALLGARGKGKTQLAINYCGLIFKYEENFEIKYIQPKPDEHSDFKVGNQLFTPDYIGFERVTGTISGMTIPSSYDGILYLRQEYNRRNLKKQQAYADSKPMPNFPKLFFLIDELQTLISREKEFIDSDVIKSENLRANQTFCGKVIRDAISLGRSLDIIVLVLGQLANPSVYGWLRQDLTQFVTIIMSANIAEFAANYAPTKEEKNRIDKELELWRRRASVDPSKDFYCYVRPMDQSGYLAVMPVPGKYLV